MKIPLVSIWCGLPLALNTLMVVLLLGAGPACGAVIVPYAEDFNSGTAANFNPGASLGGSGGSNSWTLPGTTYQNTFIGGTGTTTLAYSAIQATNLGGSPVSASDFTIATDFQITADLGSNNAQVGLAMLGNNNTFRSFTSDRYYYVTFQVTGTSIGAMGIGQENGTGGLTPVSGMFDGTFALNTTYHMEVTGVYDSGMLTLSYSLDDPNDAFAPTVLSTGPFTPAFTGNWFGFRDRAGNGGATVNYDNFLLTNTVVPEPASGALILGSLAAGLGLRARGRRTNG